MKILLDENMPESVRRALRRLGHEADSVASLRLKGLENGPLYREVAVRYDLCFTKDRGFADSVRRLGQSVTVKLVLVVLPQAPAAVFTQSFLDHFACTNWTAVGSGQEWPPA